MGGYITDKTSYYKLKQKFFSFTGDYMVKDREDKDLIRVAGRLDMRDSKTAFDPEGIKLAFFQNKMLSLRKNYYVFSYKPVCEGQESTEMDGNDVPVYRWAKIEKDIIAISPCFTCYLFTNNEDCYPIIRGEAQFGSLMFNMKIMMHKDRPNGKGQPIVGQFGTQTVFELGTDSWGVKIARGMDPLLTIIFCIAVEDLNNDDDD